MAHRLLYSLMPAFLTLSEAFSNSSIGIGTTLLGISFFICSMDTSMICRGSTMLLRHVSTVARTDKPNTGSRGGLWTLQQERGGIFYWLQYAASPLDATQFYTLDFWRWRKTENHQSGLDIFSGNHEFLYQISHQSFYKLFRYFTRKHWRKTQGNTKVSRSVLW